MKLTPVRVPSSQSDATIWDLKHRRQTQARLYMDYLEQIDEVVLSPWISEQIKAEVIQIVGSHVARYVVRRNCSNGIFMVEHTGTRSSWTSYEILTDGVVPEHIQAMSTEEIIANLRKHHVEVTQAKVTSFDDALTHATHDERLPVVVTYERVRPLGYGNMHQVKFTVTPPTQFRAWHSLWKPGKAFDLDIIPAYHPVMDDSKKDTWLINGSTDALIRGEAVRSVHAPYQEGDKKEKHLFGSSWDKVAHPYYVTGTHIEMSISATKVLSAEGIEEVVNVLAALLELDKQYVAVSGGFRSGYTHPQNVADRSKIYTTSHRGQARGSEDRCVWAHQVLEAEGELKKAYIPPWFYREKWLEAYAAYGYTDDF